MRVSQCPSFFCFFFLRQENVPPSFFSLPKGDAADLGYYKYKCLDSLLDLFKEYPVLSVDLSKCSGAGSKLWFCLTICYKAPGLDPQQNLELVEVHQH